MNIKNRNNNVTKESLVINELSKLCHDNELNNFPELNSIIINYYVKLNQENKPCFRVKLVAELSNELSFFLLKNQFQAPKAVIDFSLYIAKSQSQFRRKIATLQMLAFSLITLFK